MYGNSPDRSNTAWVAALGVACAVGCVVAGFAAPPDHGALRPLRFKQIQVDPLEMPEPTLQPMTFDGEPCWSRGRVVNVRAGPSTRKKKVTSVTNGTPLRCVDKEKRWYQVRLENRQEGWIRGDLLIHEQPKSYRSKAKDARSQVQSGHHRAALGTWSDATAIGQETSEAYQAFATALASAALERANSHAAGQPLTRHASRRNPIAAVLPCESKHPTEESVYTLYRALEVKGPKDPRPTFLVTSPERKGAWAALHLQGSDIHGRGGRLEVSEGPAGCEIRMVLTLSWQESLDTWARAATVAGAADGRFVEVSL